MQYILNIGKSDWMNLLTQNRPNLKHQKKKKKKMAT